MIESAFTGESYPVGTPGTNYTGFGWVPDCEDDAFLDEYTRCADCGKWHKRAEGYETYDGRHICQACYEGEYGTCDGTGEIYPCSMLHTVYKTFSDYENDEGLTVCEEELNTRYKQCAGCYEYFSTRFEGFVRIRSKYYSLGWLESGDNEDFRECEGCGDWFPAEDMNSTDSGCYCDSCHDSRADDDDSDDVIHSYHDYEIPSAIGEGPLWLGLEIEVVTDAKTESANKERAQEVLDAVGDHRIVLSHDGSIGRNTGKLGFEIITAPMSLKEQRKTWESAGWNRVRRFLSGDNADCGIHVHLSRAALSKPQIDRFAAFINAEANRTFVERIARRSGSTYAVIQHKKLGYTMKEDPERYSAVNLTNSDTVELRIFKGNSRSDRIIQCAEFAQALVTYCGPCRGHSDEVLSYKAFTKWVRENRKEYKYLDTRLVELGYLSAMKSKPASVVTQTQPVTTEAEELDGDNVTQPSGANSLLPAPRRLPAGAFHISPQEVANIVDRAGAPEVRRALAILAASTYPQVNPAHNFRHPCGWLVTRTDQVQERIEPLLWRDCPSDWTAEHAFDRYVGRNSNAIANETRDALWLPHLACWVPADRLWVIRQILEWTQVVQARHSEDAKRAARLVLEARGFHVEESTGEVFKIPGTGMLDYQTVAALDPRAIPPTHWERSQCGGLPDEVAAGSLAPGPDSLTGSPSIVDEPLTTITGTITARQNGESVPYVRWTTPPVSEPEPEQVSSSRHDPNHPEYDPSDDLF